MALGDPATPINYVLRDAEDLNAKKRIKIEAANVIALLNSGRSGTAVPTVDQLITDTKKLAAYLTDDTK